MSTVSYTGACHHEKIRYECIIFGCISSSYKAIQEEHLSIKLTMEVACIKVAIIIDRIDSVVVYASYIYSRTCIKEATNVRLKKCTSEKNA